MIRAIAADIGTWPAFGILILLCCLFFGYLVPKAKAPIFANVGTKLAPKVLDEYFPSWTPQIAATFFAAIGPDGRAAYRRFYWTMDFWYPGATASLATASLLLIAFPPASGWAWLCSIAIISWLFDVAENITHFRMAGSYPSLSAAALKFGPSFTPCEMGVCDHAATNCINWARLAATPRAVTSRVTPVGIKGPAH